ncbi:MAG: hypothetical protein FJ161_05115 [Gammaproteobacteria bacterium]|nr:hypothetical protein [Gammaproteobacteria bacterium]
MKDFDIRNIFCSDRLRRLSSEQTQAASRRNAAYSKDSLKKSMNELLSEIVTSLGSDSGSTGSDLSDLSDGKTLH